jgi:CHASE3 domain sensor protein
MSKRLTPTIVMAVAAISLAAPLHAQGRSVVSSAELDAAVAARPATSREAVRNILLTDQAQKVASRMGISPSELSARVATLDSATLNRVAEQAAVKDQALAGGSTTVVIGTTVLIVALLVLIILLVA